MKHAEGGDHAGHLVDDAGTFQNGPGLGCFPIGILLGRREELVVRAKVLSLESVPPVAITERRMLCRPAWDPVDPVR